MIAVSELLIFIPQVFFSCVWVKVPAVFIFGLLEHILYADIFDHRAAEGPVEINKQSEDH